MPARMSRSLSDVPLRSLTSFSFATTSIASGKHHDRRGHIKRQTVRLKCGKLSGTGWIQSPDDLAPQGLGLILAGQFRASDLGPGVKPDCDDVAALFRAVLDVDRRDITTTDRVRLYRVIQ